MTPLYSPFVHQRWHGLARLTLGLWVALLGGSVNAGPEHGKPEPWLIFLLIGQSNMSGRGTIEAQDLIIHPRVFTLTKEMTWTAAIDPLHFDKPDLAGVGLASTFGRCVADQMPGAMIGLVPAAVGGTSLDRWQPGGELYTNAVKRARAAMQSGRLAGILWHQGEADRAPEKTATYAVRFQAMITQLRRDLDAPDGLLIIGELGRFCGDQAAINEVISKLPEQIPHCAFVSSEGLTDGGDHTHFNSSSLRTFGRRYAELWLALSRGEGGAAGRIPLMTELRK